MQTESPVLGLMVLDGSFRLKEDEMESTVLSDLNDPELVEADILLVALEWNGMVHVAPFSGETAKPDAALLFAATVHIQGQSCAFIYMADKSDIVAWFGEYPYESDFGRLPRLSREWFERLVRKHNALNGTNIPLSGEMARTTTQHANPVVPECFVPKAASQTNYPETPGMYI